MANGRWLCAGCRAQVSVMAGTIFQDSKLPLTMWFRAIWQLTSQKNGVSALSLQRELGLGSYKTAWTMLHKLRRAMVRPGRERLQGIVEVDEAYWGGEEANVRGRLTYAKARIAVAAEADGQRIGRIRLRHIADTSRKTLLVRAPLILSIRTMFRNGSMHSPSWVETLACIPRLSSDFDTKTLVGDILNP